MYDETDSCNMHEDSKQIMDVLVSITQKKAGSKIIEMKIVRMTQYRPFIVKLRAKIFQNTVCQMVLYQTFEVVYLFS